MFSDNIMKISSMTKANTPSHKGIWNNKTVLKGLEKISEHGTTFVAATTLAMATGVRPIAIGLTPDVKKENKQYAVTNSIASGLIKFGIVEAIAIPVENAVKKIDKNPEKYLSEKAIKSLRFSRKTPYCVSLRLPRWLRRLLFRPTRRIWNISILKRLPVFFAC